MHIRLGDIVHVQTYNPFGLGIQLAQAQWHKAWCKRHGREYRKPWGSHDGIIVRDQHGEFCVGESLACKGGTLTPWTTYLSNIAKGRCKVRIYRMKGWEDPGVSRLAAHTAAAWLDKVHGTKYDYAGIYSISKAMAKYILFNLDKRIRDWEWANWCTEGVGLAYRIPPVCIELFDTQSPTPMHVEQAAGELAHKTGSAITLECVWDSTVPFHASYPVPHPRDSSSPLVSG